MLIYILNHTVHSSRTALNNTMLTFLEEKDALERALEIFSEVCENVDGLRKALAGDFDRKLIDGICDQTYTDMRIRGNNFGHEGPCTETNGHEIFSVGSTEFGGELYYDGGMFVLTVIAVEISK